MKKKLEDLIVVAVLIFIASYVLSRCFPPILNHVKVDSYEHHPFAPGTEDR